MRGASSLAQVALVCSSLFLQALFHFVLQNYVCIRSQRTRQHAWAGTNVVMRAKAFMEVGCLPTYTLTEDYALGMELRMHGWQCRYLKVGPVACATVQRVLGSRLRPMTASLVQEYLAVGEAPDDIRNCFQQRSRWAKVCSGLTEGALTCMSSLCVLPTGTQVAKSCTHAGPLPVHPEPQALAAAAAAPARLRQTHVLQQPLELSCVGSGHSCLHSHPRPHHLAR